MTWKFRGHGLIPTFSPLDARQKLGGMVCFDIWKHIPRSYIYIYTYIPWISPTPAPCPSMHWSKRKSRGNQDVFTVKSVGVRFQVPLKTIQGPVNGGLHLPASAGRWVKPSKAPVAHRATMASPHQFFCGKFNGSKVFCACIKLPCLNLCKQSGCCIGI